MPNDEHHENGADEGARIDEEMAAHGTHSASAAPVANDGSG